MLWLVGGIGNVLAPMANGDAASAIASLIKLPSMLADLAIGYLLYRLVLSWRRPHLDAQRLALLAAALYVLNPVTWYDSAIWGQTDAVGSLVLLLTVAALVRGNSEGASALAVVAVLVKPQFGVVALPLVGIVLLRRHLLQGAQVPQHRCCCRSGCAAGSRTSAAPGGLSRRPSCALVVLLVLILPFSLDLPGIVHQVAQGGRWLRVPERQRLQRLGARWRRWRHAARLRRRLVVRHRGPARPAARRGHRRRAAGDRLPASASSASRGSTTGVRSSSVTIFLALAFFILPTRVHERYMFPIFALLPIMAVVDRRWMAATVVLSIAAFINMHGVLTTPLYATPNLENLPWATGSASRPSSSSPSCSSSAASPSSPGA